MTGRVILFSSVAYRARHEAREARARHEYREHHRGYQYGDVASGSRYGGDQFWPEYYAWNDWCRCIIRD